ncbi:MAG: hypothetical protein M1823_000924 [Watsoniomyces obsoletus]|nr:MAG: hypothetical protein M1823_000924 [Watsoniomyces obsoletus]
MKALRPSGLEVLTSRTLNLEWPIRHGRCYKSTWTAHAQAVQGDTQHDVKLSPAGHLSPNNGRLVKPEIRIPKLPTRFNAPTPAPSQVSNTDTSIRKVVAEGKPKPDDVRREVDERKPLPRKHVPRPVTVTPLEEFRRASSIAFQQQNPHKLLRLLRNHSKDEEFLRSIPATWMSELFHLLDSDRFLGPIRDLHANMSLIATKYINVQPLRPMLEEYAGLLDTLTQQRWKLGCHLSLSDYAILLKSAGASGQDYLVDRLWAGLQRDRYVPDGACLNHLASAKGQAGLMFPEFNYMVRVQKHETKERATLEDPKSKAALDGWAAQKRAKVVRIFEEMMKNGIRSDEKFLCTMMRAMATEADVEGMGWVLKSVWNVDVTMLLEQPDGIPEPVKKHEKDSPLHPSDELLYTLAYGFGANNDVSTAFRLVDFVAREYHLTIPLRVWSELLSWTLVLSRPRYDADRTFSVGKLPLSTIDALWKLMIAEPYNVKPTMTMYNHQIAGLFLRGMTYQMMEHMREGRKLYEKSLEEFRKAQRKLELVKGLHRRGVKLHIPGLTLDRVRRDLELARLTKARDHRILWRWGRFALRATSRFHGWNNHYERRELPNIIAEWRELLPVEFFYKLNCGIEERGGGRGGGGGGYVWIHNNSLRGQTQMEHPEYDLITLKPRIEERSSGGGGFDVGDNEDEDEDEDAEWIEDAEKEYERQEGERREIAARNSLAGDL